MWWIPQIPGTPFFVPVDTLAEGAKLLVTLADYDLFQYEHHVKPDYSNAGGIERWEDGEWWEVESDEYEVLSGGAPHE